jgi:hypothetical protein
MTCRRRKKKCDETHPECKSMFLSSTESCPLTNARQQLPPRRLCLPRIRFATKLAKTVQYQSTGPAAKQGNLRIKPEPVPSSSIIHPPSAVASAVRKYPTGTRVGPSSISWSGLAGRFASRSLGISANSD